MVSGIRRFFVLAGIAVLQGGCQDPPLAPDQGQASLGSTATLIAPSNLSAAAVSPRRIRLTWEDKSNNETGFQVYRSTTGPTGTFAWLTRIDANVRSYADTGLSPAKQYCYKVRAFRRVGTTTSYSSFSPQACSTTPPLAGAPAAPTGTIATSINSSTVAVTWGDRSADETGFRIERATSFSGPWAAAATIGPNLTSFSDGARASETQVCYRVAAFNANGQSSWSETGCAIPPAGPTNVRAAGSDPTAFDLTWSDNSAFEDGYQIQRATAAGGPYSVIAEVAANGTTYRDAGLAGDQLHWYRLRAKRAGGFSDFSTPAAAVAATTIPLAPTFVSASPLNGSWTDIIWRDNSTNEAGIRVERSRAGGPWATIGSGGPATEGVSQLLRDSESYPIETEICYRIVAFNGVGESSDTGCTALPALPIDLAVRVVDGVVELTWTDVSRFEDGFYIVRADGLSMGFYYVYDGVGANTITYRDLNPDPEWSSYYLRGMKGPEGYSCCSNAVDVYMPPAPQ
jgi:fibronectin type 3 domain-containing protein